MDISWLGRTCFRLRGREGAVVTDPCPPDSGYRIGKPAAEIVTLSRHADPAYSFVAGVAGEPRVLDAPGEYEVGGILVTGSASHRSDGTRNVAFVCELDGIRVGHLGLFDGTAKSEDLEPLKGVDILLLPVGGLNALSGAAAADVMTALDARIAIPMNYRTDQEKLEFDPIDRFLKETGAKPEPQLRLQITRSQLPAELTVMLLQPKS